MNRACILHYVFNTIEFRRIFFEHTSKLDFSISVKNVKSLPILLHFAKEKNIIITIQKKIN